MLEAMQNYFDVRTANAFDMTVAQVRTMNWLERDGRVEAISRTCGGLLIEWYDADNHYWQGLVGADGVVRWNP